MLISNCKAEQRSILVASSRNCPYLCTESGDGYAMEIVTSIFDKIDTEFQFAELPWSRLKRELDKGKIDIIPFISREQKWDVKLSEKPIIISKACFFTKKSNPWWYSGVPSLQTVSLGLVKDADNFPISDEFSDYIVNNKSNYSRIQFSRTLEANHLLFRKLLKGRIDVVLADLNIANYSINLVGKDSFQAAGCLKNNIEYFLGFSAGVTVEIQRKLNEQMWGFLADPTNKALADKYNIFDVRLAGR